MAMTLGPYDQFYLAVLVLAGTFLAAAGLIWLTQRAPCAGFLQSFRGIAQNFLTVINVIFALNLAFLANDTWIARDRALGAVFQEAGSLRTVRDLAGSLPDAAEAEIATAITRYAALVAGAEWPALARRESSPEAGDALDRLLELLAGDAVARSANPSVAAPLLAQAIAVRQQRDLRIALSQTHVNPLKWLGMAFLGFLTMTSIAMVHVDQARAQLAAIALFAIAAAPTAAIILIHGNPFQEPLAVSVAPIAAVIDAGRPPAKP